MYPYINLFGLSIPSYGLMMALAFIAAILIAYHRTNKAGLDTDALLTLAIITLTCGLAGSYLLYIFVTYSLSEIWGSIVDVFSKAADWYSTEGSSSACFPVGYTCTQKKPASMNTRLLLFPQFRLPTPLGESAVSLPDAVTGE